ncbi:hypothetical protein B0T26DRAFT_648858 [Lasiosphaeria miniovina]|uniref:SnoaL-like domain-containing protein n=1 Tax=Lasiosphaeria miniovina TaxID=1954250 RepID=A0AA40DVL8_9PEZI|nr:uncharacterized protein B0T26DRAFT_648858 [Lasiosphaeria miniovina]KAK0713388.1 hypothetical protein B0T26DRAFT_648858 [Lasiosphaeria miniovina]
MSPAHHAELREAIKKTVDMFVRGYQVASEHKDTKYLSTVLTPDCTRYFSPASFLVLYGAPPGVGLDNAAYEASFAAELPYGWCVGSDLANVTIDTDARTAAATSTYTMQFADGTTLADFEFAWFLNFSADGARVSKIVEWVDATTTGTFHAKIKELQAKAEAGEK